MCDVKAFRTAVMLRKIDEIKEYLANGFDLNTKVSDFENKTVFAVAIMNRDLDIVKILLDAKPDINAKDDNGYTALHKEIERCENDIAELLIEAGANLSIKTNTGDSPLHCACRVGNTGIIEKLVNLGADVNELNGAYLSPLDVAIESDCIECIPTLLSLGCNINKYAPEQEMSPLDRAMLNRNDEIRKLLQDNGAECTEYVESLTFAVLTQDVNRVKELTKAGEDPNTRTGDGYTLLGKALNKGYADIVSVLIEAGADVNLTNGADNTPMIICATNYRTDAMAENVRLIATAGADVNAIGSGGNSALTNVCFWNNIYAARILLAHGANVNHITLSGGTALIDATSANSHEIVQLLLDNGADVNIRNNKGKSALYIALGHRGSQEIADTLLAAGASVDVVSEANENYTILHLVVDRENIELVKKCIKEGCDVNAVATNGKTPLWMAVDDNLIDIARQLINAGADVNYRNISERYKGESILALAIRKVNLELIRLLCEQGADAECVNDDGDTAMTFALKTKFFTEHLQELSSITGIKIDYERALEILKERFGGNVPESVKKDLRG